MVADPSTAVWTNLVDEIQLFSQDLHPVALLSVFGFRVLLILLPTVFKLGFELEVKLENEDPGSSVLGLSLFATRMPSRRLSLPLVERIHALRRCAIPCGQIRPLHPPLGWAARRQRGQIRRVALPLLSPNRRSILRSTSRPAPALAESARRAQMRRVALPCSRRIGAACQMRPSRPAPALAESARRAQMRPESPCPCSRRSAGVLRCAPSRPAPALAESARRLNAPSRPALLSPIGAASSDAPVALPLLWINPGHLPSAARSDQPFSSKLKVFLDFLEYGQKQPRSRWIGKAQVPQCPVLIRPEHLAIEPHDGIATFQLDWVIPSQLQKLLYRSSDVRRVLGSKTCRTAHNRRSLHPNRSLATKATPTAQAYGTCPIRSRRRTTSRRGWTM